MVINSHARNRYDEARAIEAQLQNDYGYSLEMKAGGPDPLSDFLFNVKTGHCEYFSTAMAVMLRTRGIAARVVNGFLSGEYNEAANAYTVRQSDAHSWVEVYFPQTKSWVTFDPTPAAGRTEPSRSGIAGQMEKYAEAVELMWFQYVVGYDKQEQRSLATAARNQLFAFQTFLTSAFATARNVMNANRIALIATVLAVLALMLLLYIARRLRQIGWHKVRPWCRQQNEMPRVDFYERFEKLLEAKGRRREVHQTPLEFAAATGMNEADAITRTYNQVRFGGQKLSPAELGEIEQILASIENSIVHQEHSSPAYKREGI
jgi:hypothetical protein